MTALVLARRGYRVLVLEAEAAPRIKVGECLPPNARPLLEGLGLWSHLEGHGHRPSYGNRSVWGSAEPREDDFIGHVHGHGWHIDRIAFESSLADAARAAGVTWKIGVRVVGAAQVGEQVRLEVLSNEGRQGELIADFVVDATGRASRIARQLGARRERDDNLVGLATYLTAKGAPPTDSFTLVEAVEDGWWYSARLQDGRLALVRMCDADLADVEAHARGWRYDALPTHTRIRAAAFVDDAGWLSGDPPIARPAGTSRLDRIFGPHWMAVGDAACAYDPLSSYGITSAMGAGYYAACAIADHRAGNRDALAAYAALISKSHTQCLAVLADAYAAEGRWQASPFWRRRRS